MRITDTHIYFYRGFLSNWVPRNLTIKFRGEIFSNSEQIFMYLKAMFFGDEDMAYNIIKYGKDPKIAKEFGGKVRYYYESVWETKREEMMYEAVLAKFTSDESLKQKLLDTGNKILVEASPIDKIWGVMIAEDDDRILDEKNWKGRNLLGKVLMKVRDKLKQI